MDTTRAELSAADPEARAAGWESAVLAALGVEVADIPLERWGRVYEDLSAQLATDTRQLAPSSALRSERGTSADEDAVWGLVYGARTFQIAGRLLDECGGWTGGAIVDLGAGWGPFALAAALRDPAAPVHLADVSAARLSRARALFHAAGLGEPTTSVVPEAELTVLPGSGLVSFAYSLGEMGRSGASGRPLPGMGAGSSPSPVRGGLRSGKDGRRSGPGPRGPDGPERGPATEGEAAVHARRLERWVDALAPGGRLMVIEPGTRAASRRLQEVRDLLVTRGRQIVAPCLARGGCPLLADASDWCHTTWRLPLGPLGRVLADRAHRRWQELHFSWLVMGSGSSGAATVGFGGDGWERARVLELRESSRAKVVLRLCTAGGAETLTALSRGPEAQRLAALEPGAELELCRSGLDTRGDGLRVRDAGAVRIFGANHGP